MYGTAGSTLWFTCHILSGAASAVFAPRINENTKQITEVLSPSAAQELARKQMSNAQLKYAMIIFTTLPVLFTYPFFQKYFVKGVMLGSLKE